MKIEKYDCIIIDAPCSAVGTIRRNPEIFLKIKNQIFQLNLITKRKCWKKHHYC